MIYAIIYSIGSVITGFFSGYTEEDWSEPGPLMKILFWPIMLPVMLGEATKIIVVERKIRRERLEAEKKKWLEAHIP